MEQQFKNFIEILQGMKSSGLSSEFPAIRIMKVATDEFKLFILGNYWGNPQTLDEHGNGGHFDAATLATFLNDNFAIFAEEEEVDIVNVLEEEE